MKFTINEDAKEEEVIVDLTIKPATYTNGVTVYANGYALMSFKEVDGLIEYYRWADAGNNGVPIRKNSSNLIEGS